MPLGPENMGGGAPIGPDGMNNDMPPMGNDEMGDMEEPPMGDDGMGMEEPPMGDNGGGEDLDPKTQSILDIVKQLSDSGKKAVEGYAESMLDNTKQGEEGDDEADNEPGDMPPMGGPNEPMSEGCTYTIKQLRSIWENFGPSAEELVSDKRDKTRPRKKMKPMYSVSPFSNPKR